MFEAEYLLFCNGKSADSNGNVTLSGIFDFIVAQSYPAARPELLVTTKLRAKKAVNKELEIKLVVQIENEIILDVSQTQKVIVEKDAACSFDFNLQALPFPRAGKYFFNVSIDGKLAISSFLLLKDVNDFVEP